MNRTVKRVTLSAAMVAMAAIPAQAQTGWGALGIHAGWMNPAHHASGAQESLGFDETVGIGGSLDLWFGQNRRWGLGLAGTWSGWNEWDTDFGGDFGHPVTTLNYDASLQWRFTRPTFETRFLPYLSLGVGGVTQNPSNSPDSPFPAEFCNGGGGTACNFEPADVRLTTSRNTQLAAVGALGMDWFVTPSVAIRLEAKDYWTDRSPYRRLSDDTFHSGGHNILLNGGLSFYLGRMRVQEPGFVREEPIIVAPPPAPAPPAEEMVMMCVVDQNNFQVRQIEAIRVPSENRTYVMQNGQRVTFESANPATAPIYSRNAQWYMADRPLTIQLEPATTTIAPADRNRMELVLFGSPAQRNAEDMVFVGTIEGTPVYAMRNEVAAFRPRLDARLSTGTDLGTILRDDAELAREFGSVTSYYVAVEPNCVFQPVSVTHFVRRTRG